MSALSQRDPEDQPMRLAEAARVVFGDERMAAALRTEARRGRLVIEKIAGKDFVTLRAISEMRAACRVQKEQGSGSGQPGNHGQTGPESGQHGSSGMDQSTVRLDAALMTLQALSQPCANTLPKSTIPPKTGAIIPLSPGSRMSSPYTRKRPESAKPGPKKQREG